GVGLPASGRRRPESGSALDRLEARLEAEIAKAESRLKAHIDTRIAAAPAEPPSDGLAHAVTALREEMVSLRQAVREASSAPGYDALVEQIVALRQLLSLRPDAAPGPVFGGGDPAEGRDDIQREMASLREALATAPSPITMTTIEALRDEVASLRTAVRSAATIPQID